MTESKPPTGDAAPRQIGVTDLVLRDAHQSLIATRMALEDMVDACMQLKVTVNGVVYDVEVEVVEEQQPALGAIFMTGGGFSAPNAAAAGPAAGAGQESGTGVRAPSAGTVAAVLVAAGNAVAGGQVLVELA